MIKLIVRPIVNTCCIHDDDTPYTCGGLCTERGESDIMQGAEPVMFDQSVSGFFSLRTCKSGLLFPLKFNNVSTMKPSFTAQTQTIYMNWSGRKDDKDSGLLKPEPLTSTYHIWLRMKTWLPRGIVMS